MSLHGVEKPGPGGRAAPTPSFKLEPLEIRRLLAGIIITKGGTYSGTWESLDPNTPAVVIDTAEKVILENSTVRSRSHLIVTTALHSDVTIRNVTGVGLNPNVAGQSPGRFFTTHDFDNVVLERNTLTNTSGIHLLRFAGNTAAGDTVKVIRNKAHNIDGRKSNGANGWQTFNTRIRKADNVKETGFTLAQFVQLDKVRRVQNAEIAWNEVINDPGNSRVEDNISIFLSSGTPGSPLRIHNNYIQGAYTIKPAQKNTQDATYQYNWGYSGGGIMLGDGIAAAAADDPGFVIAHDNQVVDTTNYGIALAAGHDLEAFDNRVVSAGMLGNGKYVAAQNVGVYVWDSYEGGAAKFYNNVAHDNVVGWMRGTLRNDWWAPEAIYDSALQSNTHWVGAITKATETAELALWQKNASGIGRTATLAGTIFNDRNGDGIRDSNDDGIANFLAYLDLDGDGARDQNEPIARSTSTGRWSFNVDPGAYTVRLQSKPGWRSTKGAFATLPVARGGETTTRTFGVSVTSLVSGIVYMDANVSGARDRLESGLPGWTVYVDADRDGVMDANERRVLTNREGRYAIVGLSGGNHQVRVVGSVNYRMTVPGAGYRSFSINAGEMVESRNFGLKRLKR